MDSSFTFSRSQWLLFAGGADRAWTGIDCACVYHKRHCAVDRSVRYIMEAEVISYCRTASCEWCHLHDTSRDRYLHDTSADGYRAFGGHGGSWTHASWTHPWNHIRARYTRTWLSKGNKNNKDSSGSRQITILHHDKFKTHKEESIDPGSHSSCGCVSDNGGTIPGIATVNQTINSATPGYAQVPKITGSVYAGQPPKNFLKDSLKVSFPQAAEIVEKQNANGTIVTGQLGEVNGYLDGEGQDPSDAGVATVEQAVLFKLRIAIQQILRIHGYGYPLSCPTLS